MNYADLKTEEELAKLEKRIKQEYAKSWKDLNKKTTEYFRKFEQRDKEYKEKLDSGAIKPPSGMTPEEHYAAWRKAQLARGKRWETMRDNMAEQIHEANKTAATYANDTTPSLYVLNHNYAAFEVDTAVKAVDGDSLSWTLADERTVKELMLQENHTDFRVLSVNPVRDYAWNTEQINKCLLAGILQGESMQGIANRFIKVMGNNQAAAIRNARTAVTSAQAAGKANAYKQANELGVETLKEWVATLDARTRDSHMALDGERVEEDATFSNGLRYPADPFGAPAEVYNCRCTMIGFMPKYSKNRKMTYTGKNAQKSFEEWETTQTQKAAINLQKIKNEDAEKMDEITDHEPISVFDLNNKYSEDIIDAIDNAPKKIKNYIYSHRDEINIINERAQGGGKFISGRGIRVNLEEDSNSEFGRWVTLFHEIGHNIDEIATRPSYFYGFEDMLKEEFEKLVQECQKYYNLNREETYKQISNNIQGVAFHSISDLFGGLSNNQCVGNYRHDADYWENELALPAEAFAHFFEATCRNDETKLEIIKQAFPESYKIFETMLEDIT